MTWTWQDFMVNYGFNYFDETIRYSRETMESEPDFVESKYFYYDARMTRDIQVRYNINKDMHVYRGVNNFTNQEPETSDYIYPVSPVGRFFYVGFRTQLGS